TLPEAMLDMVNPDRGARPSQRQRLLPRGTLPTFQREVVNGQWQQQIQRPKLLAAATWKQMATLDLESRRIFQRLPDIQDLEAINAMRQIAQEILDELRHLIRNNPEARTTLLRWQVA